MAAAASSGRKRGARVEAKQPCQGSTRREIQTGRLNDQGLGLSTFDDSPTSGNRRAAFSFIVKPERLTQPNTLLYARKVAFFSANSVARCRRSLSYVVLSCAVRKSGAYSMNVLDSMERGEAWIADWNFCTSLFLFQTTAAEAYLFVRQHATNVRWEAVGER